MIDAGLFDPLVRRVVALVGTDPVRVSVGTAILAAVVSLDGDGTTTALVTISTMLPVYRRLKMNPLILGTLLLLCNTLMNLTPWAGPTARAASALHLDVSTVFRPLIPAMLSGLAGTLVLAYAFGRMERRRLAASQHAERSPDAPLAVDPEAHALLDLPERRPKLFWFNLALTLGLLGGLVSGRAPLAILILVAFAIAVTVNYPNTKIQRERLATHAENVVGIVLLIFAAGIFTGILKGTGMVDAMADSLLRIVPSAWGPYLAPITALTSMPLTFVMSNDAYYFGVLPVIAEAGKSYGIPPEAMARASLMGQSVHGLSPLLAPMYLACGLLSVDIGEAQRFCLKWGILISFLLIAAALFTGAFPLHS
jgi:CitMHS family citrate-Mg2+:H+ or citrate-Ca2+:H+ symporter